MPDLPAAIRAYINAYNEKDVEGMIACLADEISFRNFSGKELTAEAGDKRSFEEMARFAATAFATRRQIVTNWITVADTTAVEIDYAAVVAIDLPNGWKAGQALSFSGTSLFRVRDGKITNIVDQS